MYYQVEVEGWKFIIVVVFFFLFGDLFIGEIVFWIDVEVG